MKRASTIVRPAGKRSTTKSAARWFGARLDSQPTRLDRGHRVPILLVELRNALEEQDGLQAEGIFRLSPEASVQKFVRERLEGGEEPEDVLSGCTVEVLSCLLKEWLRELPEGLWASVSKEALQEFETALSSASQDGAHLSMLLKQAMPPAQREVLLWVLDLLIDTAAHHRESKMGVEGLSAIFAPMLIHRQPAASGKHRKQGEPSPEEELRNARTAVVLCRKLLDGHIITRGPRPTPPAQPLTRSGSKRAATHAADATMRKRSSTGLTSYTEQAASLTNWDDGGS